MRSCMQNTTLWFQKRALSHRNKGRHGREGAVHTNPAWRIKGRTSDGPARQETRLVFDMSTRKETGSVVLRIDRRERQVNVSEVDGTDARANKKGEERR